MYHSKQLKHRGVKRSDSAGIFTPLLCTWYAPDYADLHSQEHITLTTPAEGPRLLEVDCPDGGLQGR